MFIAHLPAGYLLAKRVCRDRSLFFALLVGAIAPDADLVWWAVVDGGRVHHHRYFTHVPLLWVSVVLVGALLWWRMPRAGSLMAALGAGGVLHVVLDSLVGDIMWLYPWDTTFFALAHVPARFSPWWLNFMVHWSFAVEIALCAWALGAWASSARILRTSTTTGRGVRADGRPRPLSTRPRWRRAPGRPAP